MFSRSSRGRLENVLGTPQIKLPGTSLGCQIRTSPRHHFKTSPRSQIGTSREWSNRIFRGRPGDVGWETSPGRPGNQYLPAGIVKRIFKLVFMSLVMPQQNISMKLWNLKCFLKSRCPIFFQSINLFISQIVN